MKLIDLYNEIKINKPIKYSLLKNEGYYKLHIPNKESWDFIAKNLDKLGFRWLNKNPLINNNPYDKTGPTFRNNNNTIGIVNMDGNKYVSITPREYSKSLI